MAVFNSIDELYEAMDELWTWIKNDPQMAEQLLNSRLVVRFHYRKPDGVMTVDGSDGTNLKVSFGDLNQKPTIEMHMDSDLAHQFWLGKVNIPIALVSGKIVSRGPVNKALALLPVMKPAQEVYPDIAARFGKAA